MEVGTRRGRQNLRQSHHKSAAASQIALQSDLAPQESTQLADDREAEAGPFMLAGQGAAGRLAAAPECEI